MINNLMNNENNKTDSLKESVTETNELGGFCFSTTVVVTDPNSKEVLVQMRGD